jgi:ERI1 exoribonuclease 2
MKRLFETWVDCRQVFQNFYGYRPHGIEGMLAEWNLQFRGRPHSGLDDTRNLTSVVLRMMQEGCIFTPTNSMTIFHNLIIRSRYLHSLFSLESSSLLILRQCSPFHSNINRRLCVCS